ncbi:NAD(P)/FAD-dependent oxidoreductase, partial [Pseudomonas aeruginosa]|nr:NAD(P)/FAD-dependent oxidoreductase [Pseudomonas aeruginosa]
SDRAGRVVVGPDLTVAGRPEVFAIGDTASCTMADGKPVPGIAPAAKQQGKYVANLIGRRLQGKPADGPFKYRHQGNLATIGRSLAVIDMGRVKLRGAFAWWIWKLAHIYFLIGTRNRLSVALSWVWNHSIGYRGSRIIMHAISDKEPTALDKSGSLD